MYDERKAITMNERVRLLHTTDHITKLQPGTLGTVLSTDSLGTVHVKWDDGSMLGMIPGEDMWEAVDDSPPPA